ncbi:unnamed protein product [Cochlearia groenlandica]
MPGITLGDTVPNLEVKTTHNNFKLHDYFADSWTVLFSHPGDFTPVCTTELGAMGKYAHEFEHRGVKLLGLSCDDIQSHKEWVKDIEAFTIKLSFLYPSTTGRNMDEVLRALDSLLIVSKHNNKIATPVNWKPDEPVVISPSVSDKEANKMFPKGYKTADLPSNKGYLRFTDVS